MYPSGAITGQAYTYGFRPCILLKPNLQIIGGDGTSQANAYILGS